MKIKLFSILVSFIFFPLFVIGNLLGGMFAEIQAWLNNAFAMTGVYVPKWFTIIFGNIIGAFLGASISAYAIKKIYKETNLYYAMVFPVLIVFYSIFQDYTYAVENNDWSLVTFGHFIRYGCGIYFFYYCMFKINK